jgi:hypothetical protein
MDAGKLGGFWEWFRARADKVREDPRRHAPEISDMLGRLDEELGWEMGNPGGGAGWDFIVRTEDPSFRMAAHEVIASAPAIQGWRFLEWRPAHASDRMTVKLGKGRAFTVGKASASIEPDAKYPVFHLMLASPEFGEAPGDDERYAGYLMLDAILGEKGVEDAIDAIDFRAGPAGPVPAMKLADEVEARLVELRARPGKVSDDWALLSGEVEGKPMVAKIALEPDLSGMSAHPWRVDVAMGLKNPDGSGFPRPEELAALQVLDERVATWVGGRTRSVPWLTRSCDGVRTTSLYVAEPIAISDGLRAVIGEGGYTSEVRVTYDSRWQEFRRYAR